MDRIEHDAEPLAEQREFVPPPAVPVLVLAGRPDRLSRLPVAARRRAVLLHLLEMLRRAEVPHVEITTPPGDIDILPLVESAGEPIPPVIITGQHEIGALGGVAVAQAIPTRSG